MIYPMIQIQYIQKSIVYPKTLSSSRSGQILKTTLQVEKNILETSVGHAYWMTNPKEKDAPAARIKVGLYGFIWNYMDLNGFVWIYMDLCGTYIR